MYHYAPFLVWQPLRNQGWSQCNVWHVCALCRFWVSRQVTPRTRPRHAFECLAWKQIWTWQGMPLGRSCLTWEQSLECGQFLFCQSTLIVPTQTFLCFSLSAFHWLTSTTCSTTQCWNVKTGSWQTTHTGQTLIVLCMPYPSTSPSVIVVTGMLRNKSTRIKASLRESRKAWPACSVPRARPTAKLAGTLHMMFVTGFHGGNSSLSTWKPRLSLSMFCNMFVWIFFVAGSNLV